mmetsp:Transcript_6977/g.11575  ORF Transcript_6977/g.11575 Transcript_6977/m.11575 type:complete len:115 (-) Transcript_6977:70-414(-)
MFLSIALSQLMETWTCICPLSEMRTSSSRVRAEQVAPQLVAAARHAFRAEAIARAKEVALSVRTRLNGCRNKNKIEWLPAQKLLTGHSRSRLVRSSNCHLSALVGDQEPPIILP